MKVFFYRASFVALFLFFIISCQGKPEYEPAPINDGFVVIDTTRLKDSKPAFFSIRFDKKRVDFFVLKIGDRIESYLDACMKCYPHKKGFRTDGFYLVCKYCNERYPLDSLKKGIGSCYPIPLKGTLKGSVYKIDINSLKRAQKFF